MTFLIIWLVSAYVTYRMITYMTTVVDGNDVTLGEAIITVILCLGFGAVGMIMVTVYLIIGHGDVIPGMNKVVHKGKRKSRTEIEE